MLQIALHRPPITTQQPADLRIGQPLTLQRLDIHQLLLADHHDLQLDDNQAVSLKAAPDSAPDPPPTAAPRGLDSATAYGLRSIETPRTPHHQGEPVATSREKTPTFFNAHPPALLGDHWQRGEAPRPATSECGQNTLSKGKASLGDAWPAEAEGGSARGSGVDRSMPPQGDPPTFRSAPSSLLLASPRCRFGRA